MTKQEVIQRLETDIAENRKYAKRELDPEIRGQAYGEISGMVRALSYLRRLDETPQ
jgi:hypothetical protein